VAHVAAQSRAGNDGDALGKSAKSDEILPFFAFRGWAHPARPVGPTTSSPLTLPLLSLSAILLVPRLPHSSSLSLSLFFQLVSTPLSLSLSLTREEEESFFFSRSGCCWPPRPEGDFLGPVSGSSPPPGAWAGSEELPAAAAARSLQVRSSLSLSSSSF
jgi:hypothetical protein